MPRVERWWWSLHFRLFPDLFLEVVKWILGTDYLLLRYFTRLKKNNLLVYQPFQFCSPALVLTNPYDYLGHKGWDLATGWTGCWRGGRATVETSVVFVDGTHFRQIKTTAVSLIHHCAPTKSTPSTNPHDLWPTSHHFWAGKGSQSDANGLLQLGRDMGGMGVQGEACVYIGAGRWGIVGKQLTTKIGPYLIVSYSWSVVLCTMFFTKTIFIWLT